MGGSRGRERRRDGRWKLRGQRIGDAGVVDSGGESVGAVVLHMLGNVHVVGEGLDAEVDKHSVGFPAAEQFDGVLVDVGAEQRGGAARAEAACAEQGGINASDVAKFGRTGAKGGGHEGVADVVPGVVVVVGVQRGVGRGIMEPLMGGDAGESTDRAQERVGGRALCDLFAPNAVLLVSEGQAGMCQAGGFDVIQEQVGGGIDPVVSSELDITEAERCGLAVFFSMEVFTRAEEPVEGNYDEVQGHGGAAALCGMV